MESSSTNNKIIFFDGVCNLCNGTVVFIIKRDKKNRFKFAPLQSEIAKKHLGDFAYDSTDLSSIVLLDNGKIYTKSSAVLHIAKHLSGGYPLLTIFFILPKFFRDWCYTLIAKNRYRWFGKQESCMIPTPELRDKFL